MVDMMDNEKEIIDIKKQLAQMQKSIDSLNYMSKEDRRSQAEAIRNVSDSINRRLGKTVFHAQRREWEQGFDAEVQYATPTWVPINGPEDLPQKDAKYLVSIQGTIHGTIDVTTDTFLEGNFANFGHLVKAWRELPEPYQPPTEGGE